MIRQKKKVLIPEIRAELKKLYVGPEEGFEDYQLLPDAQPVSLGIGHMWRLAIDHPESKVLPCIHRAPKERSGERRLLLIS